MTGLPSSRRVPLEPPGLDTPQAVVRPEGDAVGGDAAPAPADETVNTAELDAYLERSEDWAVDVLQGKQIPEEEEAAGGALLASETLVPIPEEAGCAQTGRMVLEFIETCMPPPPPATGAGLPVNLTKVAIIGRPFAGKSLQAQRLAEAHRLLVVMPQEVVEQALAAATTYDENVAAATALDEDAAAAAAEAGEELAEPPNSAAAIVPPATLDLANAARAAFPGLCPTRCCRLIVETIRNVDQVSYSGVVLDGFPRTEAQARALEKALTGFEPPPRNCPKGSKIAPPPDEGDEPKAPHVPGIDCVIRLDVPDEMCRRRALGRRLDPQTARCIISSSPAARRASPPSTSGSCPSRRRRPGGEPAGRAGRVRGRRGGAGAVVHRSWPARADQRRGGARRGRRRGRRRP